MFIKRSPLLSKNQTGRRMHALVEMFHGDLGPMADLSLPEFFNHVKNIPYKRDKRGTETIARPLQIFRAFPNGIDCKKKAILIASWLRAHGIPYRFIAAAEAPHTRFHHVFPQGAMGGKWRNLDATYPKYRMFQKKALTRAEVLKP